LGAIVYSSEPGDATSPGAGVALEPGPPSTGIVWAVGVYVSDPAGIPELLIVLLS